MQIARASVNLYYAGSSHEPSPLVKPVSGRDSGCVQHFMSAFFHLLIFSLVVIMAGQGVKASAEMLKNAVIANPTSKHTATVGIGVYKCQRT